MTLNKTKIAEFMREEADFLAPPKLRLDDLPPRHTGSIKLSYMMSTYNRYSQLGRALEMLCRQNFKEFEVLINDDGSTRDVKGLVNSFRAFLNIKYFHTLRVEWVSCPSGAYKRMLPECEGEVIAVAHPEMMLHPEAVRILYEGTFHGYNKGDVKYSHLNDYDIKKPRKDAWIWVTPRPLYIDKVLYRSIDSVDWHTNIKNLENISGFDSGNGLSNRPNAFWRIANNGRHPWWFVGSAQRACPMWDSLQVFKGHAKIDMWFMSYRYYKDMVDCNPIKFLCYHQAHAVSAFGPDNEENPTVESIRNAGL